MNPWAILGIILAVTTALGGVYTAGKRVERANWAARIVEETKAAYQARDEALERVRDAERESFITSLKAEERAKEKIDESKRTADRVLLESNKRELRINALCASNNQRAATEAGSIAREAAEREAAELRRAYVEPLISLAREADEVTVERNLCVEIAQKDRMSHKLETR